jgi:hypothetical protein
MSRLALLALTSSLLAACGAKHAETAADTASLIRGSWNCSFSGKNLADNEDVAGTYSISYVSDGTWAASGAMKSRIEKKPIELGVVSRGTWTVVDGKLEEKSTYEAATWTKIGGEVFDHGEYNRAMAIYFRENPSLDPTRNAAVTTFSELTANSMIGVDQDGNRSTCERPKA